MDRTFVACSDESRRDVFPGAYSYPIFTEANTPVGGCCAMLNVFFSDEYPEPGVHDDNEGFYVVSGRGRMKVGGREYELAPGDAMYAPAGTYHSIKKVGSGDLRVFIYHFPK